MKLTTMARMTTVALCALAWSAGATARGDLTVTTKLGNTTRIYTQLNGSVLEAIIDGLQLTANIIGMIRGIASGDPFGVLNGAIGAYREALQLGGSAGDHSASGDANVTLDPNRATSAQLTFRVVSNDDPLGAVRVGAPVLDGIRVRTPTREDFSDRGIGKDVSASVTLDLTRIRPGRYPFVFTTKETDCHQCLSVVHVVTVEVTRRCPRQGGCASQRTTYDRAASAWRAARGAARSIAAGASRAYLRALTRLRACTKNHRDPSACNYIELVADGPCPELAFGASATECQRMRNAQASVEPARQRMEYEWRRGVGMSCCLFGCTGGRADLPWADPSAPRNPGAN